MSFHVEHELHRRRFGRNLGVGLLLASFVGIVFALTVVKVTVGEPMQSYPGAPGEPAMTGTGAVE